MAGILTVFRDTLVNKWRTMPETVVDLTGRTVIVTGSNVGLGFEVAKRFHEMNPARLILAVRTPTKGEAAKKAILEAAAGKGKEAVAGRAEETVVEVWQLDLSSFESVRQFAKRCESELDRVDILLENAASQAPRWTVTKDGWELDLQTNVLSTFLLAGLLAPLIAKTAKLPIPRNGSALKPHIVIVASDAHCFSWLRFHNQPNMLAAMNDKAHYVQRERYPDSKALEILLAQRLAEHPMLNGNSDNSDVIVCTVNPGLCRTELLRDWSIITRTILYTFFARTSSEGAKTYTWAALTDNIPRGAYTSSCTVAPTGGIVSSKEADKVRDQVWTELATVLTKEAPETASIWNF